MDKIYQLYVIEIFWYEIWEFNDYFVLSGEGQFYIIMILLLNVIGSLYMGYGFNNVIMDVLICYCCMQGCNILWQLGIDYVGIVIQMVVECQFGVQGVSCYDFGWEKFLEKVWEWKEQFGGNIIWQICCLGFLVDWLCECFIMDDGFFEVVKEVFVCLYEDGLIYCGKCLVNWDIKLYIVIFDLEVENYDEKGYFWYLCYLLVNGVKISEGLDYLVVVIICLEILLGDVVVVVYLEDECYVKLIGQFVELLIVGWCILIVVDEYVDCEFGIGCVKIILVYDFNDYEVGKCYDLLLINIFDKNVVVLVQVQVFYFDGSVNLNFDFSLLQSYVGMDCFVVCKVIVVEFEVMGLFEKVDDYVLKVLKGDCFGIVIEFWLIDQWYVSIKLLVEDVIVVVEDGCIQFVFKQYENMYFFWMCDIQDWCISCQFWWGYCILVWYDEVGNVYVGCDEVEVCIKYKFGNEVELCQDEDVFDIWFSFGLWIFFIFGWLQQIEFFKIFYFIDVLVIGFDIIFFWVVWMIMFIMYLVKNFDGILQILFKIVYVYGLVCDGQGQKMFKFKGNVFDLLDIVDGIDFDILL